MSNNPASQNLPAGGQFAFGNYQQNAPSQNQRLSTSEDNDPDAHAGCSCSCCKSREANEADNQAVHENPKDEKVSYDPKKDMFPILMGSPRERDDDPLCPEFLKPDWSHWAEEEALSAEQHESMIPSYERNIIFKEEQKAEKQPEEDKKDHHIEENKGEMKPDTEVVIVLPQLRNSQFEEPRQSTKRNLFTPEEDEQLIKLVHQYGEGNWSLIASKMIGRNRKQVRERYTNYLSRPRTIKEFTNSEDSYILNYIQSKGKKWKDLERHMKGRSRIDIKNRYYGNLCKCAEEKSIDSEEISSESKYSPRSSVKTPTKTKKSHKSKAKNTGERFTYPNNAFPENSGKSLLPSSSQESLIKSTESCYEILLQQREKMQEMLRVINLFIGAMEKEQGIPNKIKDGVP